MPMNIRSSSHRAIAGFVLSSLSLTGCSDEPTAASDEPTYIRDIQPLLKAKCVDCHTAGGIAPFALETYEQASAAGGAVKAAVMARTMPPWLAAPGCNDYRGDRSLTDEQIELVGRWVDAGSPLGDPNDTPVVVADERLSLSRVDLELPLPQPYTPKVFPDDYRCFFLDWPAMETTYITGFGVEPGNAAIVHHAIAYVVRPVKVAEFQALDDADPEPGWACFGGPGGTPGQGPPASWIGGWVPGGLGEDFPEGTGIEVPVGAKIIVQMHYNSSSATPASDQTKIVLRTDTAVEKKAAIIPYANIQWLLGGMTIPAHSKDVVHSYSTDPMTVANLMTGGAISGSKPLTLYSVGLHMHTLGKRIATRWDRKDGTSECLIDVPRWDFNWQSNYTFRTPKQMAPGDELYLECQWDNPGSTDVKWGEGTNDEMCLAPYYVTE